MGDNQPSKRRLRSQLTKGSDEDDEPIEKPKQAKMSAAQTHPQAKVKQIEAAETPPKRSSSRVASSKETLARLVPPDEDEAFETLLLEQKKRRKHRPWYDFHILTFFQLHPHADPIFLSPFTYRLPDVLKKLDNAFTLNVIEDLSQPMKQVSLYHVEVIYQDESSKEFYLKIFGDYNAGWAESVMVEKIEKLCPEAAIGKLKPTTHGPCIRQLAAGKKPPVMTYFALLPPSGASVDKLPPVIDLNWPVTDLCRSIHGMLQGFKISDPFSKTTVHKFYHGDTNDDNYLVDRINKRLWMIDFGRSYFRWSDDFGAHYLTPRKESTPQNGTKDILTFYTFLTQLLQLTETKINSALSTDQETAAWNDLKVL